jgi:high-affinity iron transporter
MVSLFSVPAFFILFRETLEAAIILSVMMALLDRLVEDAEQRRRMKKHVWWGGG